MGSVFENNRRRFKRFPSNVSIKFRRLDLSQSQRELKLLNAVVAKSQSVTDMGVFIPTFEQLEPEIILELNFYFEPQEREVKSLAKISWVSHEKNHQGIGVEIFKVSDELYSTIIMRAKRGNWIEAADPDKEEGTGQP